MGNSVGGVLSGVNPFDYNPSSPITLFLFQTCLILLMCNLLHMVIGRLRQPKVISEVIAGVILGPTVFGQIPNYTNTVFPKESIPGLNLTSNLGIILFMFFLGLEVDTEFIKKHIKTALSIGIISLAFPFGCGCLLAIPLFHTYANQDPTARHVKFTVFMVFIAVSISVTAFPVLCRILNELRLIKDRAGIVVLAAGIINDILGWILLALSVILSNSESDPVNTVYILLCTFGWFLLYFYPLKYFLRWALIKANELDRPTPSPFATMCILFLMFISAYFTDIIGVHPIFGAFIAGLIVPRDNNYVVKLAERMEDIPNIVLIPIYFAVAGLNVDLTLLNEGRDWGYVFASIGVAISAKVVSGTAVAKLHGLYFREAAAVGILMSCKGIVEIVVLTVGYNAGIISRKIFGMFILMALVSTFVTTPLTQLVYTDEYRKKIQQKINKNTDSDNEKSLFESEDVIIEDSEVHSLEKFEQIRTFYPSEVITIINSVDSIPPNLELLDLLISGRSCSMKSIHNTQENMVSRKSSVSTLKSRSNRIKKFLSPHKEEMELSMATIAEAPSSFDAIIPLKAVHLRMLTERTADLLQSSAYYNDDPQFTASTDSVLQIFDIFSRISKLPFSSDVIFSTVREKATNIVSMDYNETDVILISLKGIMLMGKNNLVLNDEYSSFDGIYSHILGVNELSSSFFQTIAASLKAHFLLHITNSSGKLVVDRFKIKSFNLLLPNPNLSSSDYFAIHTLIAICYGELRNGHSLHATIFVNSKNAELSNMLRDLFSNDDWLDISILNIVTIDTTLSETSESSSFIDSVMDSGLINKYDIEESTFIIPEHLFSKYDPFNEEVKETILHAANKKFNVLVAHYNYHNTNFKKSESIS
ncbi:hypothetical protein Kpol_463p7 [Vanderwaltozyma polyspora DSM 70294]|uniref:Cation/H+ exchanger transmembrane domain-containing protein n=1 Tax=Vanderwaltozyma polyspora (strain ATCC 22028 / DSM 70294 / BCRC 21397 / CBS 2163 / NBRC 10782 / NRRL Y-8283 / UCD 57-17) TaxID=436907 RepID=A7TQJ4_VANPO|nr:uncharacterized protein Kpol_463p7 [Vanderwaltozyma polyspora DSM 70294]EDO15458.1 hypothetical protein Kpol_463p7 [Vanderwaltozyma polyspora DSM 70294]